MAIHSLPVRGAAVAAALLLVAGPASAATGDTTTARGTATTTSVPLHVEALNLPVDLGRTTLTATTDSDTTDLAPWSAVQLTLASIGGARFGDVGVRSDGSTSFEGLDVTRNTVFGDVGATTGSLLAVADDTAGSATAAVTALTADATALNALDLSATITNVVASVDDSGAAATHSLAVAGINLDLTAILGADLLNRLPVQDLLDIAGTLGIDPPDNIGDASEVIDATETLLVEVTTVVTTADGVDTAATELLAAFNNLPSDIADAIAAIEALDPGSATILTDLTAALATFTGDALNCIDDPLPTTIDQAYLDSIVECLYNEALGDELLALQTALTNYLTAVTDAANAATAIDASTIEDILDGLLALIDELADLDIGSVSDITISQQVRAIGDSVEGSSASHTCNVTTIAALGVAPVDIADCEVGDGEALALVLDTVTGTLDTIFETIGGVDAGNGIALSLFDTVERSVTEGDDGFVRANSTVHVMRLAVPSITVSPCDFETVGQEVCALGTDLLGPLEGALDDLLGAQDTVTSALADVGDVLTALGEPLDATTGTAASGAVATVIDALQVVLDGLDLRSLGTGGGIVTPGVTVVVDPVLDAEHQVTTASVGDPGPADPAPGDPSDDPLPNTGGGAALMAILAIGAGAWLWRRREAE